MSDRRLDASLAIALLLVASLSVTAVSTSAAAAELASADSVLLEISVTDTGDAVWQVEYRYRLDDRNATLAFETISDRIDEKPGRYVDRFGDRLRDSVWAAENATGRDMAARNMTVTTARQSIPQATGTFGHVTYRFRWTAFAIANGSMIRAGDAIHGFYLSPRTKLILTWPDGYTPAAPIRPTPNEHGPTRAIWEGETEFAADEPRLVLTRRTPTPAQGIPESATATAADQQPADSGGPPWALLGAGLFVLGLVGAGGAILYKRQTGPDDTSADELLSTEEQVVQVLRDHGGRMKQQALAEACGWHESKTSKVVQRLRDDGSIETFRIGRENVLSLTEENDD